MYQLIDIRLTIGDVISFPNGSLLYVSKVLDSTFMGIRLVRNYGFRGHYKIASSEEKEELYVNQPYYILAKNVERHSIEW